MKKTFRLIMAAAAILSAAISCDKSGTHSQKKDKSSYEFGYADCSDYGDYYGNGKRNIVINLVDGELDEDGYLVGEGSQLILDITCAAASTGIPTGFYTCAAEPGEEFTFTAGAEDTYTLREYLQMFEDAGFEIDWSEYTTDELKETYTDPINSYMWYQTIEDGEEVGEYALITKGSFEISKSGSNYTVEGSVEVDGKEVKFSYSGEIPVYDEEGEDDGDDSGSTGGDVDRSNYDVINVTGLSKALFRYYGEAYGETAKPYSDWELNLAGSDFNFTSYEGKSPCVILEVITPETDKGSAGISAGKFNMVSDLTVSTIVPGALLPCYEDDGYYFGTMLLEYFEADGEYEAGSYISASGTAGSATISRNGNNYTIDFTIHDDEYGITFAGTYTGTASIEDHSSAASPLTTKASSQPYKWYHAYSFGYKSNHYVAAREKAKAQKAHEAKVVNNAKKFHRL